MSLETFIAGYVTCALWSSDDESDEQGGNPLNQNYTADDIAPVSLEKIRSECEAFFTAHEETWRERWSDEEAGHDFWLTRNRHGSGFWARFSGPSAAHIGRKLAEASQAAGERNLYIGDDGKIYHD